MPKHCPCPVCRGYRLSDIILRTLPVLLALVIIGLALALICGGHHAQ